MLHYQLAREPSAPRVSAWRKLKKLGAVLVGDAIWVLPENPRNREQFHWLSAEILEHDGTVSLWTGESVLGHQDGELERAFDALVEPGYARILDELSDADPNLTALSKQFQTLQSQDHLRSELGQRVRLELERAAKQLKERT
jgi:hypothetical protein